MPEGGLLRLAAREVSLDQADCAATGFDLAPGRFVELTVADTGVGMSAEVMDRIFEPFFTTKAAGKGTGLGLAAVYGTVKEHRGAVLVHSSPGAGTTFRVLLPAALDGGASGHPPAQEARPPRPARRGRVLVVEDEPRIRQLVVRHLGAAGFETIEVGDGEAALAAATGGGAFDLAVLDLVLPRLGGQKVFEALRTARPGIPVLLTSGFAREEGLATMLREPATGFLEKPWRPSELLDAVERLCG
jgi:CheY-like chemotaxis protein